ncbi:MAG: hypothetical protein UU32_C0022G0009 [Candidatus Woesebacteria bacterium GW2011_GWB1_41_10]|uniref:DUF5667 domain-containing protein n=1 Tax=Candidatus Woesebacteria bacterium GW2011_GWB1_41_10 TaxID=1618577 RepID=A0A0G0UAW6_9BACT|nr:MAG: hypothetical protein UU32_C0022G0009 [Candidatus Woesebacteria bacterium GW2011_GWB1_41_10]
MLIFFEMKKVLFALTLLVTLIFAPGGVVLAAEKVNPGDDYKYVIKRLKEKVVLFFFSASPNKKINFYKNLIDIRLAELKYVVERKDIANFQTVSQRYTATNGEATDLVLEKGTKGDREKLIGKFKSHIPLLTKLEEPYVPDNSEWRFLQDNINSLESYISRLSE